MKRVWNEYPHTQSRPGGLTKLEETELTDGQGRALFGHRWVCQADHQTGAGSDPKALCT
jgi:hypothetical protein